MSCCDTCITSSRCRSASWKGTLPPMALRRRSGGCAASHQAVRVGAPPSRAKNTLQQGSLEARRQLSATCCAPPSTPGCKRCHLVSDPQECSNLIDRFVVAPAGARRGRLSAPAPAPGALPGSLRLM